MSKKAQNIFEQAVDQISGNADPKTQKVQSESTPDSIPTQLTPKSHKFPIFKIIVIVVVVLIVAGGASAGYYFYNLKNKPENVVKQMLVNMAKVEAYKTKADFNVKVSMGGNRGGFFSSNNLNLNITLDGAYDNFDKENKKADIKASLNYEVMENKLNFGGDMKYFNKSLYLKVNELPSEYMIRIGMDLDIFKDQWISVDYDNLKEKYSREIGLLEDSMGEIKEPNKEQINDLKEIFKDSNFIVVDKKLKDEGDDLHYDFHIDIINLKVFVYQYADVLTRENLSINIKENFYEELDDFFEKFEENVDEITGELWIDKDTLLLSKYTVGLIISEENSDAIGVVSLTQEFSDFNQDFDIKEPSESMSVQEAMKIFEEEMNKTRINRIPGSDKDTDEDGLNDQMETYIGTNPQKADTDDDGYSDKEEIDNGYNPRGEGTIPEYTMDNIKRYNEITKDNINPKAGGTIEVE